MILETKKLWFKKAVFFLEDVLPTRAVLEQKYSSVNIISYQKLDLPGWRVREKDTALIDLTLTEDEIFRKFNDTTRNEIRRTFKSNNLVFSGPQPLTQEIYDMYVNFERSQSRVPISYKEACSFVFFVASYNNKLISCISVVQSGSYLRVRSIFSARLQSDFEIKKIIGNASRRIMWGVCLWGKNNGFTSLDLASVDKSNPGVSSIVAFKLSFGGNVVSEYTHIYKSKTFSLFEEIFLIKSKCVKFLHNIVNKI